MNIDDFNFFCIPMINFNLCLKYNKSSKSLKSSYNKIKYRVGNRIDSKLIKINVSVIVRRQNCSRDLLIFSISYMLCLPLFHIYCIYLRVSHMVEYNDN